MEGQIIFRSIVAVFGLLCFLGICYWAYFCRTAQPGFDEAAQLPLADDDDLPARPAEKEGNTNG